MALRKLNHIIQIITNLLGKKECSFSNKHYQNIKRGEQIELNGKKYVKVKLRFVDSMDFNLDKHVDNLECENELLKKELSKLKRKFELCRAKLDQIQACNINTFRESNKRQGIIDNNDLQILNMTSQLKEKDKTITGQRKTISSLMKKMNRKLY